MTNTLSASYSNSMKKVIFLLMVLVFRNLLKFSSIQGTYTLEFSLESHSNKQEFKNIEI